MKISEKMRRELEEQFSPEQVEEGLRRLEWIVRVRDRGEDCQTVLNEFVAIGNTSASWTFTASEA